MQNTSAIAKASYPTDQNKDKGYLFKKYLDDALAGVAQWTECRPVSQRVTGLIPNQGTCLGCRPGPG